jgi:hypothetical protein
MRKEVNSVEYTQINTVNNAYLMQYLGSGELYVVVSGTQPLADAYPDFILSYQDGIRSNDIEGILWAKTNNITNGIVGFYE